MRIANKMSLMMFDKVEGEEGYVCLRRVGCTEE
jgi:hypothetical protein